MYFDQKFINKVLPDAAFIGSYVDQHISFSVDSRTTQQGEFFVALVGARVDGHNFIEEAFARGAHGAMIDHTKKDILNEQ